jgi:hypothetical protein
VTIKDLQQNYNEAFTDGQQDIVGKVKRILGNISPSRFNNEGWDAIYHIEKLLKEYENT